MKMTKIKLFLWAALGLPLGATSATATTIMLKNPGSGYRDQSFSGGEFRAIGVDAGGIALLASSASYYSNLVTSNVGGLGGIEVFCLEKTQTFSWDTTMAAEISLGARPGGVGASGGLDKISLGSAYLYSNFAAGTYSLYSYTPGSARAADARAFQKAIWYLEDEISLTEADDGDGGLYGNEFLNDIATIYTLADAKVDNNAFEGVAALNLGGAPGYPRQDQLIMSDRGFCVPDGGATALLMGFALSGLGVLRRKLA